MQIIQRLSPNRQLGRNGQKPDIIVCHQTGGSFSSAVNTIMNRASQVSYHFVVSSRGEIIQAVDIDNTAWANGTSLDGGTRDNRHSPHQLVNTRRRNANSYTVSIGFADTASGTLTPPQFDAAVDLIHYIRDHVQLRYDLLIPLSRLHIIGHHEVTPRTRPNCPGRDFPFDALLLCLNCGRRVREV